ncbi:hypothetical protein F5884DRAFT_84107 [Xylogone sp. PMI_703]|nr:hypothetical protein F5884DRAFT_84107 [Xylogone sp. PMI_703]
MTVPIPALQQISLSLSVAKDAIAPATATSYKRRDRDLKVVRQHTDPYHFGDAYPFRLNERHSAFTICMTSSFKDQVEDLHKLLDRALIDIVERWFQDTQAAFPSRMPLEPHEEDLLRWIDGPGSKMVPNFATRYGMWRTDYLIERDAEGVESPRICEINARIPFNGFWMSGLHEEAMKLLGAGTKGFDIPNNFETTKEAIINCFDRTKPLHHIRSKWTGVDSRFLEIEYHKRTGQKMVHVQPSELRLKSDSTSPTGYTLWYTYEQRSGETETSEWIEQRVDQCSLELFQEEIAQIDPLVLRQLATCCVNDFRNILLFHDKRILGIVLEELPSMVQRHRLSAEEAARLKAGIPTTLLPGTEHMRTLLEQSRSDAQLKDSYIVKPIRDAACQGIQLGKQLSQTEWLDNLERLSQKHLLPHEDTYIIQNVVKHVWYDIVRHDVEQVPGGEQFHLIGSSHMINSSLYVNGPWRVGLDVNVGLLKNGIVLSTVLRPDFPLLERMEEEEN